MSPPYHPAKKYMFSVSQSHFFPHRLAKLSPAQASLASCPVAYHTGKNPSRRNHKSIRRSSFPPDMKEHENPNRKVYSYKKVVQEGSVFEQRPLFTRFADYFTNLQEMKINNQTKNDLDLNYSSKIASFENPHLHPVDPIPPTANIILSDQNRISFHSIHKYPMHALGEVEMIGYHNSVAALNVRSSHLLQSLIIHSRFLPMQKESTPSVSQESSSKNQYTLGDLNDSKIRHLVQLAQLRNLPIFHSRYLKEKFILNSFSLNRTIQKITSLPPAHPSSSSGRFPLWIALLHNDNVGNIGSILRSSHYFAVDGVILTKDANIDLVSLSSCGAADYLHLKILKGQKKAFISSSQENGWKIVSTVPEKYISDPSFLQPTLPQGDIHPLSSSSSSQDLCPLQ
eukprot:Sdes_comp14697_c0_seq1m3553